MDRPDFGIGKKRLHKIIWTEDRIAYVRYLACLGKSAAEIAIDIGLTRDQRDRVRAICSKHNIALGAIGGRPCGDQRYNVLRISVPSRHIPMLSDLAGKRAISTEELSRRLVRAMLEQGATLLENLLDDQEETIGA